LSVERGSDKSGVVGCAPLYDVHTPVVTSPHNAQTRILETIPNVSSAVAAIIPLVSVFEQSDPRVTQCGVLVSDHLPASRRLLFAPAAPYRDNVRRFDDSIELNRVS